jgi:dolichol-phosphate mannosyltransferase
MTLEAVSKPPAEGLAAAPLLSIIVPTYNEAENLGALIERLRVVLGTVSWEVIFADDNSPDGTHRLAKQIAANNSQVRCLRRVGRRGLAGACIDGILSSSARYVAVMDGDLQHDEAILLRMLHRLEDDEADVVIGTRYRLGGSALGLVGYRDTISRAATVLTHRLLRVSISDPMSGFFMVKRECFEDIAPRLSHDGFKILLDMLATANGELRVAEEPYDFRERVAGESKFDLRTGLEFLGLLAAKMSGDMIEARFIPYALIGSFGLLVHLSVLSATLGIGFSFTASQSLATFVAMLSNFFLNNMLTYKDLRLHGAQLLRGLLAFCAIGATGFLANVGVASWLYGAHSVWWLAGVAGALTGVVWNYAMSSRFVWRVR